MDPELVIIRTLGAGALYVGGAIAGIWLIAGVFALVDAWRAYDPARSTRRGPIRSD
jgi:hypothetical protein